MSILQFIFSFLYKRNWYTGKQELSLPRVALLGGMVFLIVVAVVLALVLQTPVTYDALSS